MFAGDNGENKNLVLGSRNLEGVTLVEDQGRDGVTTCWVSPNGLSETAAKNCLRRSQLTLRSDQKSPIRHRGKRRCKKAAERTLCFEVAKEANKVMVRPPWSSCSGESSMTFGPESGSVKLPPPRTVLRLSLGLKKAYVTLKVGQKMPEYSEIYERTFTTCR